MEALKREVDRTLLRENLWLSPEQRVLELVALLEASRAFEEAGREHRSR